MTQRVRVDIAYMVIGWVLAQVAGFAVDTFGTPEFKRMIEASGYLQYWRTKAFPPQCRPLGADDFHCD